MSENQGLESQDQNKIIEYDNVKYLLNEKENTAGIIEYKFELQQIHIPATIKKETKEFNVTRIMEGSLTYLRTESIDFASDSKLQTIEKNSFYDAHIKRITIPSSVTLIGESAFQHCVRLESIEFSNDSKLQTIGKKAFFKSTIKCIKIPSSVTLIGESAFSKCKQLQRVEIPNDSKLRTIEKNAFSLSKIESITIPSEFINLKEGWCNATLNITEIIVSPNNPRYCLYENNLLLGKARIEDNNYDCLVFCNRNIKHIKIPNFIKHICSYSFNHCEQLETIEISSESKLETINKHAFSGTIIKSITIPSSVKLIGEVAFSYCKQLEKVEIPNDSKLKTIGKDAFLNIKIENITIPSELINLRE